MRLSDYPLKFLTCRDLGHAWFYEEWVRGKRTDICPNCTTRRRVLLTAGEVIARTYSYPKGYLIGDGIALDKARDVRARLARLAQAGKLRIRWAGNSSGAISRLA